MQKIDLDAMSIEELAQLSEDAAAKLAQKVAARQKELEAELARLAHYNKPRKAPAATRAPKEQSRAAESGEPAAKAA
jgi:hypothetical protein